MGLANDMDDLQDTDSCAECPCCGGPKHEDCSGACNGCYKRFENPTYEPDMEDAPGEMVFHDWGVRPTTADQVEVGQAWVFEPAPGERSVWLVESIEQTAIGPQVFIKRRSPRGGIKMDCYARSMVEDEEAGWTFLRHAYDAEQFAPASSEEDDEEGQEEGAEPATDEWVAVGEQPRRADASAVEVGQHWRLGSGMGLQRIKGGSVVEVVKKDASGLRVRALDTGEESGCGPYIGMIAKLVERAVAEPPSAAPATDAGWRKAPRPTGSGHEITAVGQRWCMRVPYLGFVEGEHVVITSKKPALPGAGALTVRSTRTGKEAKFGPLIDNVADLMEPVPAAEPAATPAADAAGAPRALTFVVGRVYHGEIRGIDANHNAGVDYAVVVASNGLAARVACLCGSEKCRARSIDGAKWYVGPESPRVIVKDRPAAPGQLRYGPVPMVHKEGRLLRTRPDGLVDCLCGSADCNNNPWKAPSSRFVRDEAAVPAPAVAAPQTKAVAVPVVGSVWRPTGSPFALDWGDVTVTSASPSYVGYRYANGKEASQSLERFLRNAMLRE